MGEMNYRMAALEARRYAERAANIALNHYDYEKRDRAARFASLLNQEAIRLQDIHEAQSFVDGMALHDAGVRIGPA